MRALLRPRRARSARAVLRPSTFRWGDTASRNGRASASMISRAGAGPSRSTSLDVPSGSWRTPACSPAAVAAVEGDGAMRMGDASGVDLLRTWREEGAAAAAGVDGASAVASRAPPSLPSLVSSSEVAAWADPRAALAVRGRFGCLPEGSAFFISSSCLCLCVPVKFFTSARRPKTAGFSAAVAATCEGGGR